jgi:hypothetical protein
MRLLFLISITLAACSEGGSGKKDMGSTTGGGFICPNHPENCQGTCCGDKCLNTMVDRNNCGACNAACGGGTICMGGHCGCLPTGAPCATGQTCCPMGGCADLQTSVRDCGSCGHGCETGETCVAGQCVCGTAACTGTDVCCNGTCKATCMVTMPPDMSMPNTKPFCDCSGLAITCIITGQCIGNNCCLEDTFVNPPPAGTCEDPTPCEPSTT